MGERRTTDPPVSLELCSSLRGVRGVGLRRAEGLASAGITTVQDLLFTLPYRYEDRSRFVPLAEVTPGKRVTVSGSITTARLRRTRVKGFTLFDLVVADPTGDAAAVWYNQPYLRNVLRMGERVVLFGESTLQEKGRWRLLFKNPEFELLAEDPERIHTGRIVPIYRRTGGLSTRMLRTLIHRALDCLPPELPDPLPHSLVLRLGLADRATALRQTHFPMPGTPLSLLEEGRTLAHRRLALEELYGLQRDFARSRSLRACCKGIPFPVTQAARRNLTALSPFSLTAAQERALREILADLAEPRPMFRLLQGDVGCGKTLVALLASVAVMEQGGQVALMVPTEILAEQHHRRALDLLEGTGHAVALLTSQSRSDSDGNLLPTIAGGEVGMVVGTHALIQEAVRFRRLGLVVVDEQHRFGVRQRELLRDKGTEPHQLFMTATPIPRSLALAFYGDLDVTRIDEMPPGRLPVRTLLRKPVDRDKIYRFIRKEVGRGGKAAIIVPAISSDEVSSDVSAVRIFDRLSTGVFSDLGVGLLHGRLSSEERRRTMLEFARGDVQVVVATTVVEVGLDVPEASVVVVENADRFGLSQLHQLRGRVGRGVRSSWCILIAAEKTTPQATERLKTLTQVSDGFEIARRDLELRGPGELLGHRQSGDPDFRVAKLSRDLDLLELAREAAGRAVDISHSE